MRKSLAFAIVLLMSTTLFSGCLNSDNDYEISTDCAINSVVMGTLNRLYTIYYEDGTDSSYNITVPGSTFPLHIDQLTRRVYNTDSLPVGTDVTKVIFSTFSADGTVAYRLESGKDTLFSTSDSIDFTNPRVFTVYAADAVGKREYTFDIRVHKVDPDGFSWTQAAPANSSLAAATGMRIIENGGKLYLWGVKDGAGMLLTRSIEGSSDWQESAITGVEGINTTTVNLFAGKFYAIATSGLVTSADGAVWAAVNTSITPDRILAVTDNEIFVTAGGKAFHSEDLTTWTEDTLDDDAALLPQTNIHSAVMPAVNNSQIQNVVTVGYADTLCMVWKKEQNKLYPEDTEWSYYPNTEETPSTLPYFKDFSMMHYDGVLYGVGSTSDTVRVYKSVDGARTWAKSAVHTALPKTLGHPTAVSAATDNDNNIWIACSGTGILWKGYLNRLKADSNN